MANHYNHPWFVSSCVSACVCTSVHACVHVTCVCICVICKSLCMYVRVYPLCVWNYQEVITLIRPVVLVPYATEIKINGIKPSRR